MPKDDGASGDLFLEIGRGDVTDFSLPLPRSVGTDQGATEIELEEGVGTG
jgi:hypothetical protein